MEQKNSKAIEACLKQHHLFSKLTELQLDRVYKNSQITRLGEGQVLFNQSEKVKAFYMVLSGKIKLFRMSADGQEKIIEIVNQGEVFAEALMFTDQTDYPVSSAALSETEVLCINSEKFKILLLDAPGTCLVLHGDMSLRLRKLISEIDI